MDCALGLNCHVAQQISIINYEQQVEFAFDAEQSMLEKDLVRIERYFA